MSIDSKAVAVVNSCEGNSIDVTILDQAKDQRLDGSLVELEIDGEDVHQWALGRMGIVSMRNPYHENPSMTAVIAHYGRIEYLSGAADVCNATIDLISCVDKDSEQIGPRATPPSSATPVFRVGANGLDKYRPEKNNQAVIGHLSGYSDVPISIINKGFQEQENGGWGEAKHDAYFGRNGSGKTVKAAMDIVCQLVACPEMGCLIPDTAGDLSRKGSHSKGEFKFDMFELLEQGGRSYEILNIQDIALSSKAVFVSRLYPLLIKRLSTNGDKARELAERVAEDLFGDGKVKIDDVNESQLFESIMDMIPVTFTGRTRGDKLNLFGAIIERKKLRASFMKAYENEVASLFRGEHQIDSLIKGFLWHGKIVVIKMFGIPAEDQKFVMQEIFEKTTRQAEKAFHTSGEMVNAKVILDEGPRWVPQDRKKQDGVSNVIVDAFNTTRKYGLGWTIISQRVTAISKDVLAQCHTTWYGKGLGVGADADHVKRELGDDGYQQYLAMQLLGGYPWIGIGDTINLGVGNQYIALSPFGGNANEKLMAANQHIWNIDLADF
ncbi:atpase [Leptolyngbya sp. Heron Island J]|uniref:ATP-binding protein n=1 Tax=Leptolyngbya sp. Heron Island J TaxID=1385935 RepID=UPI0003B9DE12|nr:zonular occludens toxin domain-containing protein [Leptolyngbya sp. Heron Island J]ESA39123.1 atpase [Leptolyngbya sp. Heron Island J]